MRTEGANAALGGFVMSFVNQMYCWWNNDELKVLKGGLWGRGWVGSHEKVVVLKDLQYLELL